MVPLIKGMLIRGDEQSDIAACFLVNSGRVAEINTGQRSPEVHTAPAEELPPPFPYPSPYELWKAQTSLLAARVALEAVQEKIGQALIAVGNAESRIK
ncbi:hypothetical protein [Bradyrhizobium sp. USDA 377]